MVSQRKAKQSVACLQGVHEVGATPCGLSARRHDTQSRGEVGSKYVEARAAAYSNCQVTDWLARKLSWYRQLSSIMSKI